MESLMLNNIIHEADYLDYIYGIANIFCLSSSDKYIIFAMKVEHNQCSAKMTIYNQEGISKEYQDVTIKCDESFYNFLKQLVQNIEEVASITKKDIVNLDRDEYVAFRMITSHNDLITIDGLEKHQAELLLGYSDEATSNSIITNHDGHSSFVQLLLMIGIISISFITIVLLVD